MPETSQYIENVQPNSKVSESSIVVRASAFLQVGRSGVQSMLTSMTSTIETYSHLFIIHTLLSVTKKHTWVPIVDITNTY